MPRKRAVDNRNLTSDSNQTNIHNKSNDIMHNKISSVSVTVASLSENNFLFE